MGPRSLRVLDVLRETIEQAEKSPGLGPDDPGVIQLKQILSRWTAEIEAEAGGAIASGPNARPAADVQEKF
jgi:hypothetical protein